MLQPINSKAEFPKPFESGGQTSDAKFLGADLQERFAFLLMGFNAAYYDLLEASGPGCIRSTEEEDVYEITISGPMSKSTLKTAVVSDGEMDRLEPENFRSELFLPLLPVFSYNQECKDAYVIRMMTCWLERAFLIHEAAILKGIRALSN